ncbi:MAG: phosphoribosylformylglycinamidine synthase subunit PurS [Actinobacteria bacterium]|nr:phosphoribosylformylglycinamidine synthase subunit PurS [Actinomycetota bacterium]
MRFRAEVCVWLKPGLLDPAGKAVEGSLPALGWNNVTDVRVGRYVQLDLDADDEGAAFEQVRAMSEQLLSNPVIETYRVMDVRELSSTSAQDDS